MLEADVGAGTGASVFLAEHPRPSGLHAPSTRGASTASASAARRYRSRSAERAAAHGITIVRGLRIDRAPVGHRLLVRRSRRQAPRHRRPTRCPASRSGSLDDDGVAGRAGRAGEIWSRGPDLCVGYTDPALTADAFDDDGWYRTRRHGRARRRRLPHDHRPGEGRDHPRRREHLRGRGRGGDRARSPQVAEVAVVAAPDERLGEHACAVVRLAPGVALARARRHHRRSSSAIGLARQKWPEELRIVDDFPRTAIGQGPQGRSARASARGPGTVR